MVRTLFFIANAEDLNIINVDKIDFLDSKIIAFDITGHKKLEQKKINHEISDSFLTENDRIKLFDLAVTLHDWYKDKHVSSQLEFENVNLLALMDTIEFQSFIMPELINFSAIKKIIEKENPIKIITTSHLARIAKSISTDKNIEVIIHKTTIVNETYWDTILIKHNIGKFPISLKISRNKYFKIKNFVEQLVCSTYGFWFNFKNTTKKTILLLEFYPPLYQKLLLELKKSNVNVVLINRRRPAISDFESIKILQKSGSQIINFNKILSKEEKSNILSLTQSYYIKLEKIWSNNDFFNSLFKIDNSSFWYIISDKLLSVYKRRLIDYLTLILSIKKIFTKINIQCILSLYEVGETEKAFLEVNKNKIPSIILEHGFSIFFPEYSRYDILSSYSNFKDKIAVWSNLQKKYLVEYRKIIPDKILVTGSPRHDLFFEMKSLQKVKRKNIVLIAPTPITELQGHDEILAHIRFEDTLKRICSTLKQNPDVEIIVKTHPSQSTHNNEIISIISEIDSAIPIYLFRPIIELLDLCDAVITITPEGFAPSTIILDAMIRSKPVMNIVLDDHVYDFDYVKNNAVLSLSYKESLKEHIFNMLFDYEFRNKMINNGNEFVRNFLVNRGNASVELAKILNLY